MYAYSKPAKSYQPGGNRVLSICENSTKEICWLLPRVTAPTAFAMPFSPVMVNCSKAFSIMAVNASTFYLHGILVSEIWFFASDLHHLVCFMANVFPDSSTT